MMENASQLTSLILQALNEISALQKDIGNLQGQANLIISDQQRATDSRSKIQDSIAGMATDVALLKTTVQRIAPLVDEHEQKHQRGLGVIWLIRTGWFIAGGALIGAVAKLFGK